MLRRAGFTIVELLIVIVIIGILAVIAMSSFNEAQRNARNANTFALASAYRKALITYATDKGAYPTTGSVCIGKGYPDINGDTLGDCRFTGTTVDISENNAVNQALSAYADTNSPLSNFSRISNGSAHRMGVIFQHIGGGSPATLDGQAHPWWLRYTVEGTATTVKCQTGPPAAYSGPYPTFTRSPPSDGSTEPFGSSARECWLPLPNPANL